MRPCTSRSPPAGRSSRTTPCQRCRAVLRLEARTGTRDAPALVVHRPGRCQRAPRDRPPAAGHRGSTSRRNPRIGRPRFSVMSRQPGRPAVPPCLFRRPGAWPTVRRWPVRGPSEHPAMPSAPRAGQGGWMTAVLRRLPTNPASAVSSSSPRSRLLATEVADISSPWWVATSSARQVGYGHGPSNSRMDSSAGDAGRGRATAARRGRKPLARPPGGALAAGQKGAGVVGVTAGVFRMPG